MIRWAIEEFFRVLKSGLRGEADARRPRCRHRPRRRPAILKRAPRSFGVRPKAPPNPTIRESAVELGRLAGFQSSKRQPLPGIQKLWSAWTDFAPMMLLYRDFRTYGMDDEPDELTVEN